jgi:pimeloyl-ACP methyl ester carboxylesterase
MVPHGDGLVMKARWVDIDGIRVHCLTAGGVGSPVVLLHGGIDSASFTYSNIIGPLATGGHRVLAPDWPGYGQTYKPNLDYTMDFYVDFLGHLMDALGSRGPASPASRWAVGQLWDLRCTHHNVSRSWSWWIATA